MKINTTYFISGLSLFLSLSSAIKAQDLSNPGSYMSYIGEKEKEVTKKYLNYISAASHGKSLRKVEKLRTQVINSIYETRIAIQGTPAFQGDKTLRDASVAYLMLCYRVFNEDYGKIVNMEEIAEQSYDAMEAYMLAQKMANDKLDEAGVPVTLTRYEGLIHDSGLLNPLAHIPAVQTATLQAAAVLRKALAEQ